MPPLSRTTNSRLELNNKLVKRRITGQMMRNTSQQYSKINFTNIDLQPPMRN